MSCDCSSIRLELNENWHLGLTRSCANGSQADRTGFSAGTAVTAERATWTSGSQPIDIAKTRLPSPACGRTDQRRPQEACARPGAAPSPCRATLQDGLPRRVSWACPRIDSCSAGSGRRSASLTNTGRARRRSFARIATIQCREGSVSLRVLTREFWCIGGRAGGMRSGGGSKGGVCASARSQRCFNDQWLGWPPRPNENCRLRIRFASSMPAKVMAAVLNDFKPNIQAQRGLIARWSCSTMLLR